MSIDPKKIFNYSEEWNRALNNRENIGAKPSVYLLSSSKMFGRLYGKSKVLYIGSTGRLGGKSQNARLRIYRYPNGKHARELRRRCKELESKKQTITLHWTYKKTKLLAAKEETKLLKLCFKEYGEHPPFNSKG